MSNNSAGTAVDCGLSSTFWEACKLVIYVTYTIAPPICFVVGLPSHFIALTAFLKHRNSDTGYSYQILATVSRILEILGMFIFSLFFYHGAGQDWSGAGPSDGPIWFMSNDGLMWFSAHLSPMLAAAVTDIATYVSAAMAADRVFSLWKPFLYQTINHKRHFLSAVAACFLMPLIGDLHLSFNFEVVPVANSSKYQIQYDVDFVESPTRATWSNVNAAVRSVAEGTLIVCSVLMIIRFKQRNKKVQQLVSSDAIKEARRKANERTLFFLALFQCTATTLPGFLITAWDVINTFSPSFVYCGGTMLSPVTDLVLQLVNSADVYFMLCVSYSFRQMIKSALLRGSDHSEKMVRDDQRRRADHGMKSPTATLWH